jgi:hypothetical protein
MSFSCLRATVPYNILYGISLRIPINRINNLLLEDAIRSLIFSLGFLFHGCLLSSSSPLSPFPIEESAGEDEDEEIRIGEGEGEGEGEGKPEEPILLIPCQKFQDL